MKVDPKKELVNPPKTEPKSSPLDRIFTELEDRLDSRNDETDDDTPAYTMMQRINSQINRAQSGEGPFTARFMDIAEIALAAILTIRRSQS